MTTFGLRRVRRSFNLALNQIRSRVAILLYHRIAEHIPDPQLLCVSSGNFEEHLQYLRDYCQPISLFQLNQALLSGRLPRRAVVITFDDGYADNFWSAKSLLERYDYPATIFVVSGYVGKDRELVSDELDRLLLESPVLPDKLCLTIAGKTYSWQVGGTPAQLSAWDVTQDGFPTSRHRCYFDLHKLLRPMNQDNRERALTELWHQVGGSAHARQTRRVMNVDELRELAKSNLIDVGAHTISHLLLTAQPVEVQWQEIMGSKEQLEQFLGRPVTSFAYPYGGVSAAAGTKTLDLVRQAGFHMACSTMSGLVALATDPFLLPRCLVRDWSGDEFARRLRAFFAQ